MDGRLTALMVVALLVLSVTAIGCGDDDGSSGSADTAAEGIDRTIADDVPARTPKVAVEQCKSSVVASLTSADTKEDLAKLCEEARSGDPDDVRQALGGVCERLIKETIPPGSAGRDRALATCARDAQL